MLKYGLRKFLYSGNWYATRPDYVRGNRGRNRATNVVAGKRHTAWHRCNNNLGYISLNRGMSKRARQAAREEIAQELNDLQLDEEIRRVYARGWRHWTKARHLHGLVDEEQLAALESEHCTSSCHQSLWAVDYDDGWSRDHDDNDWSRDHDDNDWPRDHDDNDWSRDHDDNDWWRDHDDNDWPRDHDDWVQSSDPTSRVWLELWLAGVRHNASLDEDLLWDRRYCDSWYQDSDDTEEWRDPDWSMADALQTSPYEDWIALTQDQYQLQEALRDRHVHDAQRNRERLRSGERYYRQNKRSVMQPIITADKNTSKAALRPLRTQ